MFVLIGITRPELPLDDGSARYRVKTFGPFATEDDARDYCNAIGLTGPIEWLVQPLMGAADDVRA